MRRLFQSRKTPPIDQDDPPRRSTLTASPSRKTFPSGIKPLYSPDDGIVDIVFVHGLTGDRERTWTAHDASGPWPKILLPSKLPTARILTFGYDAYVSDWRGVVSQNRIGNHAWNLLTSLASHREEDDTNERPIIFVCHSLGGLVCQDALVTSKQRTERHLQNILRWTRGIAFLGTPHHGAGLARWAELLSRSIGVVKQTNPEIVEVLRRDSEVLARIQESFHTIVMTRSKEGQPIEISCFYEELPLLGVGLIVPQDSATLPGHIPIGIRNNHRDMTKFVSTDDPGFLAVYGEVRRWIKGRDTIKQTHENPPFSSNKNGSNSAVGGKCSNSYRLVFNLHGAPASNNFIDRPLDTADLEQCLLPRPNHRQTRRIFVLYGLGGIGKTQLAADFARRHRATFSSVFWLDGRSEDRLRQSIAGYASRIPKDQIPDRSRNRVLTGEDDLNIVVTDVLDWLARSDNVDWLLVFDNVDQDHEQDSATGAYDVRRYLPGDHGSVLITTRLARLAQLGDSKRLTKVDEELGKDIFCRWYGRQLTMDEPDRELLGLLDGLPLALAQAASYLRDTGVDTASYVRLYKQQWDDLMRSDSESESPLIDYDQRSIGTTWMISFKAIETRSENAANLLRLWAFLDNRDLWHGLLQAARDHQEQWPAWLREIACNEVRFLDAARLLLRCSMIESQESVHGSYLIHPVVHRWASYIQDESEKREFLQLAVMVVGASVPSKTSKAYWIRQRRLLTHAERCSFWMSGMFCAKQSFNNIMALASISTLGNLFWDQGRQKEAEKMYQLALEGKEKALGRDHELILATVNNLGSLYRDQGQLKEAEEMCQRALEGKEKALGRDHPSTLDTVNNLGVLYKD